MGQTLGDFLKITSADDYFMINIRKDKETVYFGYENEVPDDIKSFIITEIYMTGRARHWESVCLRKKNKILADSFKRC